MLWGCSMVRIGKNIANCSKNPQFLPVMCVLCLRCARAVHTRPQNVLVGKKITPSIQGNMDSPIRAEQWPLIIFQPSSVPRWPSLVKAGLPLTMTPDLSDIDVQVWRYHMLPMAFGAEEAQCQGLEVRTEEELEKILKGLAGGVKGVTIVNIYLDPNDFASFNQEFSEKLRH